MSSLLGDLNAVDSSLTSANLNANNNSDRTILKLPLNRVKLDPQNVRLEYDQDYVKELANTILRDGLLQPISVRADSDSPGEYIINMGHYRYLAHKHL
ncbi:ParB N-terminal domain-containing protein, partial [Acinetobacter baumannii]